MKKLIMMMMICCSFTVNANELENAVALQELKVDSLIIELQEELDHLYELLQALEAEVINE